MAKCKALMKLAVKGLNLHVHARLQVCVCSGYNLWLTSRHTDVDTHTEHCDQLIW